jgi:hypothetical protein
VGGGGASCFTARLNLPLFFFFFHVIFHKPSHACQQTGNNLEEISDKEEDPVKKERSDTTDDCAILTCTTPLHENVFELLVLLGTQLWVAFARVLANYFPLQTNDLSAILSTVDLNHIHEVRLELILVNQWFD